MGFYKYFRYFNILWFTLFRKVFGLVWYFVAIPFRKYARNVVYNYVLSNGLYLKRLRERPLTHIHDDNNIHKSIGWEIAPFHGSDGGYIQYRKISKLEYVLVYWLIWGWLDDDTNEDTYTTGFNNTIIRGERLTWLPAFIVASLAKANDESVKYGNSFDLGDVRGEYPQFSFWASYLWTIRNTAYNFKYMQWEENRVEMLFYHQIGSWHFGYLPEGRNKGRLVFGGF